MAGLSSAIQFNKRRGRGTATRRIPWEYVSLVLFTVVMIFFFLYVRALNSVVHHHQQQQSHHPHHDANNGHDVDAAALQQEQKRQLQNPSSSEALLQQQQEALSNNNQSNNNKTTKKKKKTNNILVLSTKLGDIRIQLREDLSKSSIEYIHKMLEAGECQRCSFYRSEKLGILQGIMKSPTIKTADIVVKGDCPPDLLDTKYAQNDHNCHGPIMTHGMVGWAGGITGPDFFIDWYKKPAKFWGAQHTAFGQVLLEESTPVMNQIWNLPTNKKGGLMYLVEPIKFQMSLMEQEEEEQKEENISNQSY